MAILPCTLALRDAILAFLRDPCFAVAWEADDGKPFDVYDRVPAKPEKPYVAVGPMKHGRTETGIGPLRPVTIRLYTASTAFQRDEAWRLADHVMTALEGLCPDLAAPWGIVVELRVEQAGDVIEAGQPKQVFFDVTATVQRMC